MATENKKYRYLLFILCFLSGLFGGITSTLLPSYLPVISNNFPHDNIDKISAVINAVFIYGMLPGGILIGYWCDKYGRKSGFLISVLCLGICTLLTSFVNNWSWLILLRFITGFGVSGVLLSSTIIISEIWPEEKKNIALGLLTICFPIGIFLAGIITYMISDWRQAFLTGIIPLALVVLIHFFIQESHTWINNRAINSSTQSIFSNKNITKNILTGSLIYGTMLIGLWAVFVWLPTWVQSLVEISDGQKERGISMMIFAGGGLLGGTFSGWIGYKAGVKKLMLLCFGGAFALSILLFKYTTTLNLLAYIYMAIIAVFFGISQGILNSYIPELFPTTHRSTATGICFNISRLFTATSVFFVGWFVNYFNGFGNTLFVFSFVFFIGFFTILFSKEKVKE